MGDAGDRNSQCMFSFVAGAAFIRGGQGMDSDGDESVATGSGGVGPRDTPSICYLVVSLLCVCYHVLSSRCLGHVLGCFFRERWLT